MIDFHIHHRSDNRWRGCGAALLSCNPPVIVTAAHCLQGVDDPSKLRVIIIITVIVTIVIITTNPWKWKRLFWCLLWRTVRPGAPVGANSMMSDTTSLAGLAVEEKLLSHFGIWVYKNQPPAFGLEPGWITTWCPISPGQLWRHQPLPLPSNRTRPWRGAASGWFQEKKSRSPRAEDQLIFWLLVMIFVECWPITVSNILSPSSCRWRILSGIQVTGILILRGSFLSQF